MIKLIVTKSNDMKALGLATLVFRSFSLENGPVL